jgi:large subunit ribosomal protein L25
MTEKLETTIALKFIGESPAVVEAGGVLVKNLDEIEVKCLPSDLISEIEVDLSSLKKFGDVIKVTDLKIPSNIEVLNDPQLIVATVVEPREEEVEIGAKIEEKVEEVEVEKKGKETKEEVEEEKE